MADGGGQQPFGYDPTQYVSQATQWANDFYTKGNDQYQWAKDQFAKNEGIANQIINSSLSNSTMFDDAARAGVSRYEQMYAPAMAEQLNFARNYASPENLALYRGQAIAGVGQAFDAQAAAASDSLKSYGLDPKAVASRLDATIRTQRAAAQAGAGTQSDINAKLTGQQLLGQAIQTGQQDAAVTNQFGSMGAANRNQAINTGLATTASGASTLGTAPQWQAMGAQQLKEWPKAELDAMDASNKQGALWNDINRTNLQAQKQAEESGSGIGAAVGAGLGLAAKFLPMAFSGGVAPGTGSRSESGMSFAYGGTVPNFAAGGFWGGFAQGMSGTYGKGGGSDPLRYRKTNTDSTNPRDAGLPGSDAIAKNAASAYGGVPVPGQEQKVEDTPPAVVGGGGESDASAFADSGYDSGYGASSSGYGGIGGGDVGIAGIAGLGGGDVGGGTGIGSGETYARGGVTIGPLGRLAQHIAGGGMPQPQMQAIQTGSVVPQSAQVPGIPGPDTVPALVAPGEGVFPKDVMQWRGEQWFQKEIVKARREMETQRVAKPEENPVPPQAQQSGPTFASQGAMQ